MSTHASPGKKKPKAKAPQPGDTVWYCEEGDTEVLSVPRVEKGVLIYKERIVYTPSEFPEPHGGVWWFFIRPAYDDVVDEETPTVRIRQYVFHSAAAAREALSAALLDRLDGMRLGRFGMRSERSFSKN